MREFMWQDDILLVIRKNVEGFDILEGAAAPWDPP